MDTDHPLADLAAAEAAIAPAAATTTADRLREFEDKFCPGARVAGQIERGIGSAYAALSPEGKAHHAALEALIAAENEHHAAAAAEEAAAAKLADAIARSDETEGAL